MPGRSHHSAGEGSEPNSMKRSGDRSNPEQIRSKRANKHLIKWRFLEEEEEVLQQGEQSRRRTLSFFVT